VKMDAWRQLVKGASLRDDLREVRDLTVRHVKEETLQPIRDAGRFAMYGALGSVFVGFGVTLLLLALLRFFQEQFPVFRGTLSFIPYLIVVVAAALVAALTVWRIISGAAKRRLKADK